jgi:mRNA interferase MazF
MEVARGEIWWADLPDAVDASPSGTRPVLIIQSQTFNRSRIQTVITAVITSNMVVATAPGNVEIGVEESGLPLPSVVNVSQLFTVDRRSLRSRTGRLRTTTMDTISDGLRLAMAL